MGDHITCNPTARIRLVNALDYLVRVGAGDSSEPKQRSYLVCSVSKYEGPLSLDVQLRFHPRHEPPLYIQIDSVMEVVLPIGVGPRACAHEYQKKIPCTGAADAIEKFERWTSELPVNREDQYEAARTVCEEQLKPRYLDPR